MPDLLEFEFKSGFPNNYFLTPLPGAGAPGQNPEKHEINKKVTGLRNKIIRVAIRSRKLDFLS